MEEFTIISFLTEFNIDLSGTEFHLSDTLLIIGDCNLSEEKSHKCRKHLDEASRHIHSALKSLRKSNINLMLDDNIHKWYGISLQEKMNQFYFCKTRIITIIDIISRLLIESKKLPEDLIKAIEEIVTALSLICSLYVSAIREMKETIESENFDFLDFDMQEIIRFFADETEYAEKRDSMLFADLEKSIDETFNEFESASKIVLTDAGIEAVRKYVCQRGITFEPSIFRTLFHNFIEKISNCYHIIYQIELPASTVREEYFFKKCHDQLSTILVGYRELFNSLKMDELHALGISITWTLFYFIFEEYNVIIDSTFSDSEAEKERYGLDTAFLLDTARTLNKKYGLL